MKAFIDSENKIITSCPDCGNQSAFYLIRGSQIIHGYHVQHCENCNKPYVIDLEVELTVKIQVWKCSEIDLTENKGEK